MSRDVVLGGDCPGGNYLAGIVLEYCCFDGTRLHSCHKRQLKGEGDQHMHSSTSRKMWLCKNLTSNSGVSGKYRLYGFVGYFEYLIVNIFISTGYQRYCQ